MPFDQTRPSVEKESGADATRDATLHRQPPHTSSGSSSYYSIF